MLAVSTVAIGSVHNALADTMTITKNFKIRVSMYQETQIKSKTVKQPVQTLESEVHALQAPPTRLPLVAS